MRYVTVTLLTLLTFDKQSSGRRIVGATTALADYCQLNGGPDFSQLRPPLHRPAVRSRCHKHRSVYSTRRPIRLVEESGVSPVIESPARRMNLVCGC